MQKQSYAKNNTQLHKIYADKKYFSSENVRVCYCLNHVDFKGGHLQLTTVDTLELQIQQLKQRLSVFYEQSRNNTENTGVYGWTFLTP